MLDRSLQHGRGAPIPRRHGVTSSGQQSSATRWLLGVLLAFGALNAFGGGYYGMAGAKGIPTAWLDGSPFTDYVVPSVILFVVVGGSFLLAALAVLARRPSGRLLAQAAGVIVLGWLTVQLAVIGYVSWMQPTTAIAGIVVLALASRLSSARPPRSARRVSRRVA